MEDKEAPNSAFTMSIKGMAMLTVCSVFSLRNLPSMAEYGWNIIFFLSAAAACFFIPSALVSAELASTYPQRGGVFIWVKEAFGPKLGFLAIFMEWFQNMPWYPAAVTFVATCIAYIFNPELASNRWLSLIHISEPTRLIGFLIKFRCGCRNHYSRLFSDCLCAHLCLARQTGSNQFGQRKSAYSRPVHCKTMDAACRHDGVARRYGNELRACHLDEESALIFPEIHLPGNGHYFDPFRLRCALDFSCCSDRRSV